MIRIEYLSNNPIQSTQEVVEAVSNAFRDTFDELKVEIKETKELAKSLAERQTSNDPSGIERGRTAWPSIKRSRDIAEKSTPKSRPDSKLIGGTKEIENGHLTVETVAKPPEKFWLYLSRIARHVTEDDVSELVKKCLQTQQPIDVRKLVRKDADLKQFAFISFKVGVEKSLKDKALDPSVWPKGIFFREFENLQTNRDFWGPTKIPRMDTGTPSMITPSPIVDLTPMQ